MRSMQVFGTLHSTRSHFPSSLQKLAHAIYSDFYSHKNEIFQQKPFDFFLTFAQNIDCGYTSEPPRRGGYRGGSNECPQSMFWSKNKKGRYMPAYPSFAQVCMRRAFNVYTHQLRVLI